MMKNLCAAGRLMMKDMDLEDMAALKLCVLSLGVLVGTGIPRLSRRPVRLLAGMVYVGTLVPLGYRFIQSLTKVED